MSGHALEMECPYCGERGKHRVKTTDPTKHHSLYGPERNYQREDPFNFYYRMRTRECVNCHNKFYTVEMLNNFFCYLTDELYRFKRETDRLESEVADLKEKNKRLQQAVDRSVKQLSLVTTRKPITRSTR